jgi:hypothetical protein
MVKAAGMTVTCRNTVPVRDCVLRGQSHLAAMLRAAAADTTHQQPACKPGPATLLLLLLLLLPVSRATELWS